jgi:hypothetical protein
LSSRESKFFDATSTIKLEKLILVGPKHTNEILAKSESFLGEYWEDMHTIELPSDLNSKVMSVDEESKS